MSNTRDGVWVCDLTGRARQHTMGEDIKLHDMRTNVLEVSHFAFANDGAGVSTRVGVFWHIWDLNRYLNVTRTPATILEDSIHRHLTYYIHSHAGADLAQDTRKIEEFMKCVTNLESYGITIDDIQVIAIDAPCHNAAAPNISAPNIPAPNATAPNAASRPVTIPTAK